MSALTLPSLAERIAVEHQAAQTAARSAVEHAVACGKLLLEAKRQVGHGGWLTWVGVNCAFSQRTAQAYMRLAREFPRLDEANAQRVADLSLRDALGALGSQSANIRRLPGARVEEVLNAAGEQAEQPERLRDALVWAVNAERRPASKPADSDNTWTRVELIPMQPTPPRDRDLALAIVQAIRDRMRTQRLDTFTVLETLNSVYIHLQERRRVEGYQPPDPVADLERAFERMSPAEREAFASSVSARWQKARP